MKKILLFLTLVLMSFNLQAQSVNITQETGWLESAYIKWDPVTTADSYNVYYSGGGFTDKKIDTQLIRSYGSYFRADVLGLAAGSYTIKVAPVVGDIEGAATVSGSITVLAHDRAGFAHSDGRIPGGYNLDGTLKTNAVVQYITQNTKNNVSLNVTGANANPCIGLQAILDGFKKGNDNRPLVVRMIGNITHLTNMLNGDIVIENKNNVNSSITVEGVGSDAVANGWGIRIKLASNIEVRNIGFMLTNGGEGDNVSLQDKNDHIWIHHNDMFYGAAGGDADQAKGDGALDSKNSTDVTFSYNHFWDSGKSSLLGLKEAAKPNLRATYHHNWFDHSDSRHPRVRTYSAHIYNNYFDGNSKYGAGSTMASSLFLEGNYFRNTKYPMLISMQGTDTYSGTGTFSSEAGGMIKSFNNFITGAQRFIPYDATNFPVEFDAVVATTRNQVIPNTIKTKKGETPYNNFDTDPLSYINTLVVQEPEAARDQTMQYAGRVSGGDLRFTFDNTVDDKSYDINPALKALLTNYQTQLVFVQGETPVVVSSQTLTAPGNNDQNVATGVAISDMVFTWGGTADDASVSGLPASGITFVKNMGEKTIIVSGTPTEDVSFTVTTSGATGTPVSADGNITIEDNPANTSNIIHNFTTNGLVSSFYTFESANLNAADGNTTYDGLTLTKRLKIETATKINYKTTSVSTLTLVFNSDFAKKIKLDGSNYTAVNGVVIIPNVAAGDHSITKGDTTDLYYIKTEYGTLATGNTAIAETNIKIYPNPVTDYVMLSVPENVKIENISIYSTAGQLVKTFQGKDQKINLSNLKSGLYIMNVKSNNGSQQFKIIKK
ncbi:T9SS type A sorting domain-containing protein [Kaistella flava (ex Peng et al. 2021)]|uniref:T9SS type A sorting domain-containing protein n=1 Tax=Kaistella flava (ex Peng et al. 2021) TaxID=2038776 RepID=A0A7M2Y839_9FLAO|nr:T9SS type A sorting domain-containing protein [Kaistella flava (ex Peng et al. 2021)]QOW10428.1 T9SS type A sorting domain-containing protein [Kaistella flava (ex Peng et al. 2021)]